MPNLVERTLAEVGPGGGAAQQAATTLTDLSAQYSNLEAELTTLWVLLCALFVFQMQSGFALLEAGTVRAKNTKNILMKNAIDACVAGVCWWAVGDAFAYGKCGQNGFIGAYNFFSSEAAATGGTYWALWLWNWSFAATAATIVSGAVAERLQFKAYLCYTATLCAFIYPVVVHWVWSNSGWLSARRKGCDAAEYEPLISGTMGVMDFAGSGVVHMVGGAAALVGSIVVGPRLGRFDGKQGKPTEFAPSSPVFQTLGVFILWLGWYAFNAGSTNCFQNCMEVSAKIAVNTTLAAAFAALTCLFLAVLLGLPGDIGPVLNGVLAGAVSITAPCAMVQAYGAAIIGVVGGLVYTASSRLLLRLHVDDPLDAAPVHFCCGIWGVLSVGFFATETSTAAAYGYAADWGVFYGGSGKQLGMQLLGVVVITAWTCTLAGALFLLLKKLCWLRVPEHVERQGLDLAQGLSSGVLGRCFKRSAYSMAVESALARPSARPSMSTHATQLGGKDPLAKVEEANGY